MSHELPEQSGGDLPQRLTELRRDIGKLRQFGMITADLPPVIAAHSQDDKHESLRILDALHGDLLALNATAADVRRRIAQKRKEVQAKTDALLHESEKERRIRARMRTIESRNTKFSEDEEWISLNVKLQTRHTANTDNTLSSIEEEEHALAGLLHQINDRILSARTALQHVTAASTEQPSATPAFEKNARRSKKRKKKELRLRESRPPMADYYASELSERESSALKAPSVSPSEVSQPKPAGPSLPYSSSFVSPYRRASVVPESPPSEEELRQWWMEYAIRNGETRPQRILRHIEVDISDEKTTSDVETALSGSAAPSEALNSVAANLANSMRTLKKSIASAPTERERLMQLSFSLTLMRIAKPVTVALRQPSQFSVQQIRQPRNALSASESAEYATLLKDLYREKAKGYFFDAKAWEPEDRLRIKTLVESIDFSDLHRALRDTIFRCSRLTQKEHGLPNDHHDIQDAVDICLQLMHSNMKKNAKMFFPELRAQIPVPMQRLGALRVYIENTLQKIENTQLSLISRVEMAVTMETIAEEVKKWLAGTK